MEAKLKLYTDIYDEIDPNSPTDIEKKVREQKAEVEKLQLKVQTLEKTQAILLVEIETIGSAWKQLEAQNSKKVFEFGEKEDLILRITSEVIFF